LQDKLPGLMIASESDDNPIYKDYWGEASVLAMTKYFISYEISSRNE